MNKPTKPGTYKYTSGGLTMIVSVIRGKDGVLITSLKASVPGMPNWVRDLTVDELPEGRWEEVLTTGGGQ